jgi:ferric-dicitrate binding protein FerR (iron transport regulator)
MALIECRECGREISDQASACPGCGAPVALEAPKAAQVPPPAPRRSSNNAVNALLAIIVVILAAIAFVVASDGGVQIGSTYRGTVRGFETKGGPLVLPDLDTPLDEALSANRANRTGRVVVELEDGTRVNADCAFEGLTNGDAVKVKDDGGSWAVVEILR